MIKLFSLLVLIALFTQCKEKQSIVSSDSIEEIETASNENSESAEEDVRIIGTIETKVDSDGEIFAKLDCMNTTLVEELILATKKRNTSNFECSIHQNKNLIITFQDEDQGIELIITCYGAGSLPIKTGVYQNPTAGTEQYATIVMKSASLGNHDFQAFSGSVWISDYGMSSDIVCGGFDVTDIKNNKFKGVFNGVVSRF